MNFLCLVYFRSFERISLRFWENEVFMPIRKKKNPSPPPIVWKWSLEYTAVDVMNMHGWKQLLHIPVHVLIIVPLVGRVSALGVGNGPQLTMIMLRFDLSGIQLH